MATSQSGVDRLDSENEINRPIWQVALLGIAAGSAGGLIGVGGGVVLIPVLTYWGMSQRRAQGTSLMVIVGSVPFAILTYFLLGNIDFAFALPLAVGGVIGSMIGSLLAQKISNDTLSRAFGVLLILIALKMLFTKYSGDHIPVDLSAIELTKGALFGVLAGLLAGFFGVGGGIVFVPTGVLLGGLTQEVAQGSSFTAMLPTALMGTRAYLNAQEIVWQVAKWLIPGALVGIVLGAWGADVFPGSYLRVAFAVFLLYTGVMRIIAGNKNKSW